MAALLMPLFFFFLLLAPINDSVLQMNKVVKDLSLLDKKMGDDAEELSTTLNSALSLNEMIRSYHVECTAAAESGTLPALQAAAEITRLEQDMLIFEAQTKIRSEALNAFTSDFNAPERGAGGPCSLPDVLNCPDTEIFKIKTIDGSKPAGVRGETLDCTEVRWEYSDNRVSPLI